MDGYAGSSTLPAGDIYRILNPQNMELDSLKVGQLESKGICVADGTQNPGTSLLYLYTNSMKENRQFILITREEPRELGGEHDEEGEVYFDEDEETTICVFWYDDDSSYEFTIYADGNSDVPFDELEPYILKAIKAIENTGSDLRDVLREMSVFCTISSEINDSTTKANTVYKEVMAMVEAAEECLWV